MNSVRIWGLDSKTDEKLNSNLAWDPHKIQVRISILTQKSCTKQVFLCGTQWFCIWITESGFESGVQNTHLPLLGTFLLFSPFSLSPPDASLLLSLALGHYRARTPLPFSPITEPHILSLHYSWPNPHTGNDNSQVRWPKSSIFNNSWPKNQKIPKIPNIQLQI